MILEQDIKTSCEVPCEFRYFYIENVPDTFCYLLFVDNDSLHHAPLFIQDFYLREGTESNYAGEKPCSCLCSNA